MIIKNASLEDKELTVKIDTDNQVIFLNKKAKDITIPFNKISYLVHKAGYMIWQKDYAEFHSKDKSTFSIHIKREQIKELEKFFNIRTDILMRTEPIKRNHKYCLQVSEPWDFRDNILGTIIDVNEKRIIFKSDVNVNIQNFQGNFILHSRDGRNCNRLPLYVNASILPSEYDLLKTDDELLKNSKFVIIGSLKKCNLFEVLWHYLVIFFLYFTVIAFTMMIFKSIFDLFKIFIA